MCYTNVKLLTVENETYIYPGSTRIDKSKPPSVFAGKVSLGHSHVPLCMCVE